jgi:hypothetical protein
MIVKQPVLLGKTPEPTGSTLGDVPFMNMATNLFEPAARS